MQSFIRSLSQKWQNRSQQSGAPWSSTQAAGWDPHLVHSGKLTGISYRKSAERKGRIRWAVGRSKHHSFIHRPSYSNLLPASDVTAISTCFRKQQKTSACNPIKTHNKVTEVDQIWDIRSLSVTSERHIWCATPLRWRSGWNTHLI